MKQFSSRLFDSVDSIVPDSHQWNDSTASPGPAPDAPHFCQVTDKASACVPWNYEPGYAYPLIVWLTDEQTSADAALDHISQLSPQNYLGLTVDGCELSVSGQAMNPGDVELLTAAENQIVSAVQTMRESFNVHSDRVFLAGAGTSASAALLIALHQADWFAGAISFGGELPALARLLAHRREVAGRRFWLSGPRAESLWPESGPLVDASRSLLSMGADVTTCLDDTNVLVAKSALRRLDEWILASIFGASSDAT